MGLKKGLKKSKKSSLKWKRCTHGPPLTHFHGNSSLPCRASPACLFDGFVGAFCCSQIKLCFWDRGLGMRRKIGGCVLKPQGLNSVTITHTFNTCWVPALSLEPGSCSLPDVQKRCQWNSQMLFTILSYPSNIYEGLCFRCSPGKGRCVNVYIWR